MSIYINTFFSSLKWLIVSSTLAFFIIYIYQLKKYGSFSTKKSMVDLSFVFYIQTVFLLVILPLPSFEQSLDPMFSYAQHIQLIPFAFVRDIIKKVNPLSLNGLIKFNGFYTAFFNLLMFLPLGVYFRDLFRLNFRKTIILAYLCSLFCEVTQLTGIFFIYKQPYRLFDVDDLMINTIGAMIGYAIAPMFYFMFTVNKRKIQLEYLNNNGDVKMLPQLLIYLVDFIGYTFLCGSVAFILVFFPMFLSGTIDKFSPDFPTLNIFVSILIFIYSFIIMPMVSPLNQTFGMELLKCNAKISKKRLVVRNLILYLPFLISLKLTLLVHIYYIILMVLGKRSTFLDEKIGFSYQQYKIIKEQAKPIKSGVSF